ncbi:MAG TPA: flagellar motor switch protein FliN [Solirubrobacteraceae bacterium]|jgi:flagellar motor switch protein FliN/FliY
MSGSVAYEQFDEGGGPAAHGPRADGDLRRLSEVPVEASVEIGRIGMTVGETLELRVGSVVKLERLAGEPVDLLVNGTLIAQGEVVVADEQFGLRVTEIVEGDANSADELQGELAAEPSASASGSEAPAAEQTLQLQAPEQPA